MTFLVTGATGNVGSVVVDQLVRAGRQVRALTRNPAGASFTEGVQVFEGDLTTPETLVPALDGVEALYLFPEPTTAAEVADLAKRAGVRRIVVLSSEAVTDDPNDFHHGTVERAVRQSGVAWTHVRPGEFALNKLDSWAAGVSQGVVRLAYPDTLGVPVHEADIAAVAVAALLSDEHAGKIYRPTPAEATTQREQVEAIGAALGRKITIEQVTTDQEKQDLLEMGWPAEIVDYIQAYLARWSVQPPRPLQHVLEATGRPARSFAQWAVDHVKDFG